MKRAAFFLLASFLLASTGGAQDAEPQPSNTAQVLQKLVERQTRAMDAEEPDKAMAVFHPSAPGVDQIRATLVRQFARYDDAFRLEKTHYVGQDGKWAYMRTIQTIRGVRERAPFVMAIEELLVFRRFKHDWRAWTSVRLDQKLRKGKPQPLVSPRQPRKR